MTKLAVINMALDYLENEAVDSSTNDRTSLTKRAARWYETAALYVLNYTDWIDTVANTTFTTEASITNVWDDIWEYVYELPSDSLRVLDLDLDPTARYIVQGNYLYTNLYDATDGVNCRYVKDIRAESSGSMQYSDLLGEVIASRLAFNMAPVAQKGAFGAIFEDVLFEALKVNERSDRWTHGHENPFWTDTE